MYSNINLIFVEMLIFKLLVMTTTENNNVVISKEELLNILNGVERPTFVNLVTETKVRMNKRNNPYFDRITKLSKGNFMIGTEYGKRVLTNGEKEGISKDENTFEVEEMRGREHVSKVVCRSTNPNRPVTYYIMVERFDEVKPKVDYRFEGETIEKTLFESFLVKKSESTKQPQERKVSVLTYGIDGVREITLNKTRYVVE